jgi:trigger factor
VLELADRHDLGSCAERRKGSSPFIPTSHTDHYYKKDVALKIETQPRDDHQITIIAEFDLETLERFKHRAARQLSNKVRIPGFRPGKAPYDLILRTVGEAQVVEEAVELLVDDQYSQVLKEANIEPSGSGSLEEVVNLDPPTFRFVVPLRPEVTLGDYRAIRKPYVAEPVADSDIERVLKNLLQSYGTTETTERPAQMGDVVSIKFSAHLAEPVEGEKDELIADVPEQVLISTYDDGTVEWPYHGFSLELVGLSVGDSKAVRHTFAEGDAAEEFQGKDINFNLTVTEVKSLSVPELNDEFAASVGPFADVEALKTSIRAELEVNKNRTYTQEYLRELVDEVVEMSTVKYPPHMLEEEIHQVIHNFEDQLGKQNMDMEAYLKTQEKTREAFIEEEVKPIATRRLTRALVLDEISRVENLQLDTDELMNEVSQTLMQMNQYGELKHMPKGVSRRDFTNAIAMDTASRLMNEKIMNRLKAIATGDYPPAEEEVVTEAETPAVEETPTEEIKPVED